MADRCEDFNLMVSGKAYNSAGPELLVLRNAARTAARAFNDSDPCEPDTRHAILRGAIAHLGSNTLVEQPIRLDYGINLSIGEGTFFNFNTTFLDCAPITIGSGVMVGPNVSFLTPRHPLKAALRRKHTLPTGEECFLESAHPIVVEDDVWIAGDVTICGGVTIGHGAVIAAGSVVTRDVPPFALVAGVPARVVRIIDQDEPHDADFGTDGGLD